MSNLRDLMLRKHIVFAIILLCCLRAEGQIDSLLGRLSAAQMRHDGMFLVGTFPTLRSWAATPGDLKADNSIFFTGLIVFTLRNLEPYLTPEERILCDSIRARGIRSFPHYANRHGAPTYNFWPSDRPVFFPHSRVLGMFKESKRIADDLDDTSILWMCMDLPDSTARRLKTLMDEHAGGAATSGGSPAGGRHSRNTYAAVRDLPAYSAWFGVKTPLEFDAGVMANVLYFVYTEGLTPEVQDSAGLSFLQFILSHRKYWTDPAYASTYYPRTPLLIYHFARLIGRFHPEALMPYVPRLKEDARLALSVAVDPLDKLILRTALLRLGDTTALPSLPGDTMGLPSPSRNVGTEVFYIANIASLFPNPIRRMFLHSPLCIYEFHCPAYNDALLLEYLVLRRNLTAGTSSIPSPPPSGR